MAAIGFFEDLQLKFFSSSNSTFIDDSNIILPSVPRLGLASCAEPRSSVVRMFPNIEELYLQEIQTISAQSTCWPKLDFTYYSDRPRGTIEMAFGPNGTIDLNPTPPLISHSLATLVEAVEAVSPVVLALTIDMQSVDINFWKDLAVLDPYDPRLVFAFFAGIASLAAVATAQSALISSPTNGAVIASGANFTVQVEEGDYPENLNQVGIVLGLASCQQVDCNAYNASQEVGDLLYLGPFNPQFGSGGPPSGAPFENFSVQVPAGTSGAYALSLTQLELVGASHMRVYEVSNIVVEIQ
ncbi:uncharacterized protein FIBRA_00314 [Fibroporia radiculosa]|uniref:Uncharacterized protein n=1 Tax=Fibroporia radiculosa TaxID=599839 RepID=J7RVC8_9APHY|nr:uncharacterized protein FIBRA_00314 [Fibroporia radiculosa]CCL98320.1 predicted protein [Fibroporia radiculosa]